MIRKLIIVLLSLACLGTLALWAVSHVAPQHKGTVSSTLFRQWDLNGGDVRLLDERNRPTYAQANPVRDRHYYVPRLFSVHTCSYSAGVSFGYRRVDVRLELGTFALLLAIAFIRGPLRRRRRRKRGLCLSCGYNLTGNTSGVCPECAGKVQG